MNCTCQESIPNQRTTNERVSSLFFLLSLILHAIALSLFLIAGFRAKQRVASNPAMPQRNPFSLTSLRGRPSQVFFDDRPVSPAMGAPQGLAMPAGAKPVTKPLAKPSAFAPSELRRDEVVKAQQPSKKIASAKRKAAARPKALAQPIPLQPDNTAPITVAAAPSADQSLPRHSAERDGGTPATDQLATHPTPYVATEGRPGPIADKSNQGEDTVVFSRHANQQAADSPYVAGERRNLIAMTKGFIERTDIDELEDSIATDGQGDDEETCHGDAQREASALEFSLYRTKVGNEYVSAWHEHFSHLPIKQMYQARHGLMFNNAVITYTLSREGKLLTCTLLQSTGSPEVDRRILKSFELANFPPFPRHFAQQTFTFTESIQASHLDGSERFLELIRC